MRILVTGGAGFIGSHVVDAYRGLGHEVAVIDNLARGSERNLNPDARLFRGDIRDRDFVAAVFSGFKPEVLNHHAAQMDVRRGVREPHFDADVNILGSVVLLEGAVTHQVRRVIYASTAGAAYGEPEAFPVTERGAVNPITPYGISKHTVEHYLYTFSQLYRLPYVVLRYGNVYGPRQSSQGESGVFAIFAETMLAGMQPVLYGDGTKLRDYVYVDDVARANVAALSRGDGQIFNIASGVPTSDREVFDIVRSLLKRGDLQPTFAQKRPGEIDKICMDISKAQTFLGWTPEVTLADGAKRTVEFFQRKARNAAASVSTSESTSGRPNGAD
jgi:UDP-glucose 4-epimerase